MGAPHHPEERTTWSPALFLQQQPQGVVSGRPGLVPSQPGAVGFAGGGVAVTGVGSDPRPPLHGAPRGQEGILEGSGRLTLSPGPKVTASPCCRKGEG